MVVLNKERLKAIIPILIMISFVIYATESFSSEVEFRFEDIKARGTGCPDGSVEIIKTNDQKTASLLFSEMMVEVPQFDGINENDEEDSDNRVPTRKNNEFVSHRVCNIVIKAKVPHGQKITDVDISIDYRGATLMDPGTQALFHAKFLNFVGPNNNEHRVKGTVLRKVWRHGDVDEEWTFSESKNVEINSACGTSGRRKAKLVLKNVLKAQVKRSFRGDDVNVNAFLSLDSADAKGKMKVKFNTKPCHLGGSSSDISTLPRVKKCPRGLLWNNKLKKCVRKRRRTHRREHPRSKR